MNYYSKSRMKLSDLFLEFRPGKFLSSLIPEMLSMSHTIVPMNGIFDAEYFDISSSHIEDTFRIFVGKPATVEPDKLYPTIFALDGNAAFSSLLGTQRMLTQGGEVPPSFVIGIGYPGKTLTESMERRNRDYAPTDPGENEIKTLGGAFPAGGPAFLKFIQDELMPLLTRNYAMDTGDTTLSGVSLGGLFASWVLLTEPQTFKRYILGSPAVWWRNEQVWEWEEEFARNHKDLVARVFVSAGALEIEQHIRADAVGMAEGNPLLREYITDVINWNDEHGWPENAKLSTKFARRLQTRAYPNLKICCHNMPDENHMSAAPGITSRGLRYVNDSWEP